MTTSATEPAKSPTVYDVAAHAGVSIATVSRVLRRPEEVRASTREKVLSSVRALGYVPSGSARGLANRRTGVIGLFLPAIDALNSMIVLDDQTQSEVRVVNDMGNSSPSRTPELYYDAVLRGAQLEAWRAGFVLMIGVGEGQAPEMVVRDMAGRVDGLMVVARSVPDDVLDALTGRLPIVLIAGPRMGDDFDHVAVANTDGMQALTRHLIEDLGIRDPLYMAGPVGSPDNAERYAGFTRALADAGIDASSLRVERADFSGDKAFEIGMRLIAEARSGESPLPRAVVCANDQMAIGVHEAFRQSGVLMPDDVVLTGFDGIEAGNLSTPRLTTVSQPMEDLGRVAVHTMVERLRNPDGPPITRRLPVTVLLRESSEPTGS